MQKNAKNGSKNLKKQQTDLNTLSIKIKLSRKIDAISRKNYL